MPTMVGLAAFTATVAPDLLPMVLMTGAAGAAVSIVSATAVLAAPWLPAVSVAFAVIV